MDHKKIDDILEENMRLKAELKAEKAAKVDLFHTAFFEGIKASEMQLFEIPVGFMTFDQDGVLLSCNQTFAGLIGVDVKSLIGLKMFIQLDDTALKEALSSAIKTGKGYYEGLYRLVLSGKSTPVQCFFSVAFHEDGTFLRGLAVVQDLSQSLRAQSALKSMEGAYRSLFKNLKAAIYIQDSNGCFLDANPAAEKMYGYDKSFFIGKTPEFISAPGKNDFKDVQQKFERALRGDSQRFEFWGLRKNGEIFPKEVSVVPGSFHGEKVVIAFAQDISERYRQERLKKVLYEIANASQTINRAVDLYELIRKKLSCLIDTKNFFIGILSKKGDKLLTPYMVDQKDDIKEVPIEGTISSLVMKTRKPLLLSSEKIQEMEQSGVIGDVGSPCKSWLGVPLQVDKEVFGALVIQNYEKENAYSVDDLKLMEYVSSQIAVSIRHFANEEWIFKLTQAVEQSPVALMIADADCYVEYVNRTQKEMSGDEGVELVGRRCAKLFDPIDVAGEQVVLWKELKKKSPWQGEVRLKKADGSEYWSSLVVSTILDDKGKISSYLVLSEDVTEQIRLRQQLNQAQKMESVGTLAGGIAHDFNNLLTVVNGNAEVLIDELTEMPEAHARVLQILKSGIRAKEMTSKLLAFSRKQIFKPRVVDLNAIVGEQFSILKRLIGEDIQISMDLDPEVPLVKADPIQIGQILINLVVNARDAIQEVTTPRVKKISIQTDIRELDDAFADNHTGSVPGFHVKISVSDTGTGMEPEMLKKIFDPFFTTKEQGKGTGLGLSTVYGIVKQNSGSIYVYSEIGKGTTVNVYWPISFGALPQESEKRYSSAPNPMPRGGTEMILLVEDDPDVLEFSKTLLESYGYTVASAHDGRMALDWMEKRKQKGGTLPKLLMTDMVMPGINGLELSQELLKEVPGLKVLYSSGYTNSQIVESGALLEGLNFLQKPFSLNELLNKVRSILDEG